MIKPISPVEASAIKAQIFPEGVIQCWNDVISLHFVNGRSKFTQYEIQSLIASRMNVNVSTVFLNRWLDVEPLYESVGWKIIYDKPDRGELCGATFEFIS